MAKITNCTIDHVDVTEITYRCDVGVLTADVGFKARGIGAGVLTISGLRDNDAIAQAAETLKDLIEAEIASKYGEAPAPAVEGPKEI